jgi:F0F1-type ATP synthase gamma subunit
MTSDKGLCGGINSGILTIERPNRSAYKLFIVDEKA